MVRAACVHCHRINCPLLRAFFSLFDPVTFLTEGVVLGSGVNQRTGTGPSWTGSQNGLPTKPGRKMEL